ncbi:MAG TPA: hypothetical protein VG754_14110 [Verrucomicrobiae bacterium]|nr:hypothetical protein [Verrucomicrobiae bacterium]
MAYGTHKLSPTDVPFFFSGFIGVYTVKLVHAHDLQHLIEVNVLWLVWLVLLYWRAKARAGKILGMQVGVYSGFGIASYFVGLLMACVYYLVYANT